MVNGRPKGGKVRAPKAPAGVDPDESCIHLLCLEALLKAAAQALLCLHMSKYQIVGYHVTA